MSDSPENIQQQMEITKLQITEKFGVLESQMASSLESTGNAVSASAEAVHETVQTVTDAMQDAVHSIRQTFSLQRQFDRHPWLILGSFAVVGYIVSKYLDTRKRTINPTGPSLTSPPLSRSPIVFPPSDTQPLVELRSTALATSIPAGDMADESPAWSRLQQMAVETLIGVVREVTSRSVPAIADYLAELSSGTNGAGPNDPDRSSTSLLKKATTATDRIASDTSLASIRFDKSF